MDKNIMKHTFHLKHDLRGFAHFRDSIFFKTFIVLLVNNEQRIKCLLIQGSFIYKMKFLYTNV